ncbi:MAG: hypothetical protein R3C53_02725 [Pirellulaceae bacterium]
MQRFRFLVIFSVVGLSVGYIRADEDVAPAQSKGHSQWVGSWQSSEEFNRMLGFGGDESRRDAVCDHPTAFRLSLDKVVGQNINGRVLAIYRDIIFQRMDHRIVATGKWETEFDIDPGIETDCFVTHHNGSTYLWVGAPYAVVFGGKVSYIKGFDQSHDVMVIDFNVEEEHRTPDSVAYKRKLK